MMQSAILLPLFLQVALTFVLLFWMGRVRAKSLAAGDVKIRDVALGQNAWPERPQQIARAFHNQLETPLLFYTLIVLLLVTRQANLFFVVGAWLYVLCRLVHAGIHVTSNKVRLRFAAFSASVLVLAAMWLMFVLWIMLAG